MPEQPELERVRIVMPVSFEIRMWVAIIRDLCLIAVLVAFVAAGGSLLSHLGDSQPANPGTVLPCATPTSDEFGTFCRQGSGG